MKMANQFDGNTICTPDGEISSPAGAVNTALATSGLWWREMGVISSTDTDTVAFTIDKKFLVYVYRSYEGQKWMNSMSFHAIDVGGNEVIRAFPRQSSLVLTLESSLRSIGLDITLPAESFTSNRYSTAYITALNTALKNANSYIQIFITP